MSATTYKWSIDEWHELIESGVLADKPVELLEGEIVEMSPEGVEHWYTNHSLVKYLRKLLEDLAEVIQAQSITLDNSEPEPDITIARLPETIYMTRKPIPEDIYWLIEVSNKTLKKDLEQKAITYARNGIPEYWVIDMVNKKLIVHTQPEDDNSLSEGSHRYSQIVEYKVGVVSPQAFSDIVISLDKVLLF